MKFPLGTLLFQSFIDHVIIDFKYANDKKRQQNALKKFQLVFLVPLLVDFF